MKHIGKLIFGIIITTIGIIFLLSNLNIIPNFSIIQSISLYWPLGIILAGILIILKQRLLGTIILTTSIIFGVLFILLPNSIESNTYKSQYFEESFQNQTNVEYEINFGLSNFILNKSDENKLVTVNSENTLNKKFNYNIERNSNQNTKININENGEMDFNQILNLDNQTSKLNININKNPKTNLELHYGASDAIIDLRELDNVQNLKINCGATSTKIYLNENPININIESGLSEFTFIFPENASVEVTTKGGLIDVDFKDFKKINNIYYSKNYNSEKENIKITINAGTSSFKGETIKNE